MFKISHILFNDKKSTLINSELLCSIIERMKENDIIEAIDFSISVADIFSVLNNFSKFNFRTILDFFDILPYQV